MFFICLVNMRLYILLLLTFAITLTSCRFQRANRYIYSSPAANVTYFGQKGDSKITAFYSGDGHNKNDGYNIQAGYAITNHLSVAASYAYRGDRQKYNFDSNLFHRSFLTQRCKPIFLTALLFVTEEILLILQLDIFFL